MKKNCQKNKKKVLFIVASLIRAGAEIQLVNLINSLENKKFDKHLFTYHKRIDQYNRLDLNNIKFYNQPRKYKFDFTVIKSISEIIKKKNIDIVHCTNLFSLLIGWLSILFSRSNPQLFTAIHTTIIRSKKIKIIEKVVFQWLLRRCNRVIFVCTKQAEYWNKKYPFLFEKSVVIHNGIDIDYYNPINFQNQGNDLKSRLGIPESATVICCIAHFRKHKAHEDLIEAISLLKEEIYLLLAGEGPRKEYIKTLVKEMGMENCVKFLGSLTDVRPVLAASELSVLTSTEIETFSLAMLESMSMGVPVVATDIGGLSEAIVSGETGELVPIKEPGILAETLSKMISDKKGYSIMQNKCRELIAKKYTTERMVAGTARILSSIHVKN
jgi:glycosyltransferase involved in cell wall biosynthesis